MTAAPAAAASAAAASELPEPAALAFATVAPVLYTAMVISDPDTPAILNPEDYSAGAVDDDEIPAILQTAIPFYVNDVDVAAALC